MRHRGIGLDDRDLLVDGLVDRGGDDRPR